MKLSEKGESRLYGSHNVFYDDDIEGDVVALWELSKVWEFEPDDFTGAVVLTVEEAKLILYAIECWDTVDEQIQAIDILEARIKQAEEFQKQEEISKLKHEIALLEKEQARDNLEVKHLEEHYKNLTYSVLEQVA